MMRSDLRVPAALFVGAFALYTWTCAPGAFWLDSSELAAAGITLGVPHAPGHPLYVLIAHAAGLVPIGPVGFRVALLSALFGAVSVTLLYTLIRQLDAAVSDHPTTEWAACLPAATFAVSDALWFQSVRAEVYTLHLALALGLLVLTVGWALSERRRIGLLASGAFVLGLGAGNHHLLLLAICPALAALLLYDAQRRSAVWRGLPILIGATCAGLIVYALLPLRAAHAPLVNYGHPDTVGRFLDVIAAKVFTGSVTGSAAPLEDNLAGALDMFLGSLGPVWIVLGPLGWVVMWRRRRDLALAVLLAVVANLATKLLMVLDPTNPDAAGYFQLSMALTAAGGGVGLAFMARAGRGGLLAARVTVITALATTAMIWPADRADLATFRGPETIDTALHSDVPPGALVMTSFFAHHFNSLYQRSVSGFRPDVDVVHQGLEDHIDGGRPFAEATRRRSPDLSPALDAKLTTGQFPVDAIIALAQHRPVLLEPTLGLPVPPERLRYRSGLFAIEGPTTRVDVDAQLRSQRALLDALGDEAQSQRETLTTLAMTWLPTAATRLRQGSAAGATAALDGTDELSSGSRWVAALRGPTHALTAAEASGEPARIESVRAGLRDTDFTRLFEAGTR